MAGLHEIFAKIEHNRGAILTIAVGLLVLGACACRSNPQVSTPETTLTPQTTPLITQTAEPTKKVTTVVPKKTTTPMPDINPVPTLTSEEATAIFQGEDYLNCVEQYWKENNFDVPEVNAAKDKLKALVGREAIIHVDSDREGNFYFTINRRLKCPEHAIFGRLPEKYQKNPGLVEEEASQYETFLRKVTSSLNSPVFTLEYAEKVKEANFFPLSFNFPRIKFPEKPINNPHILRFIIGDSDLSQKLSDAALKDSRGNAIVLVIPEEQ